MGGTGVIDHFLEVFTRYIDGGFGLLGGEVGFIATTLIVIDVTLAALFWSWGADDNIIAKPDRAKQLFEALMPMKLQWIGQGDLSMAKDPEMLDLMRRSGCIGMFVGISSTLRP